MPKILKRFWLALVISLACCAAMIIMSTDIIPIGWRIFGWNWAVIVPLAYVLLLARAHLRHLADSLLARP